jgi:tRNA(fMet)-specific endonuclease VapC
MKWMLDTNICIAIIRRQPEVAIKRLCGKSVGQVGLSAVTVAELQYGAAKSTRSEAARSALSEFLLPLEVAPFDEAACVRYGVVRAKLEAAGKPIGPLDTLIAAHAVSLGVVLVTTNLREFRRVPGLTVEDWLG